MVFKMGSIALALAALSTVPLASLAQGSPVPGQNNYAAGQNSYSPGANYSASSGYAQAPVPGAAANNSYVGGASPGPNSGAGNNYGAPQAKAAAAVKSAYSKLPLNVDDAKVRIAELRNLLVVSRPQDVQESVFQLCEWLSDMADAHWKLSLALAKNDSMKAAAAQERQSAVKFSSLKHEAGLLKAELFIKQNRLPEALSPLVDIVVAEPKSLIGQAAYEKLKEIGFAEQAGAAGYQPADKSTEKPVATAPQPPQLRPQSAAAKAQPLAAASKPARTAQATKTR